MLRRVFSSANISPFFLQSATISRIGMGFTSKQPNLPKKNKKAKSGEGNTNRATKEYQKSEVGLKGESKSPVPATIYSLQSSMGVSPSLQAFIKESSEVDAKINRPLVEPKSLANPNLTLVQVEGIPKDWSAAKVRTYFDPKAENIVGVKPIVNKLGLPTGKLIMEFSNSELASKFIRRYDNDFIELPDMSAHLRARLHTLSIRSESLASKIERDRTVMLYNLPFEATNKEVATVAGYYGGLSRIDMPQNSRQRNRGYALVTFKEPQSANKMIEQFEGLTLHGREVKLKHGDFTFSPDDRPEVLAQRAENKPIHKLRSDVIWEQAETPEVKIKGYLLEKQRLFLKGELAFD